jgi:hypothetical protein
MPGGRPTELTDELAVALVEALRRLPIRYACDLVGISDQTYRNWVERGEAEEEPYASFLGLARRARAEYIGDRVGVIERAAIDDWKAAAWYLERCAPEEFKPRSAQETDLTSGGQPIQPVTIYLPSNDRDPPPAGPGEVAVEPG